MELREEENEGEKKNYGTPDHHTRLVPIQWISVALRTAHESVCSLCSISSSIKSSQRRVSNSASVLTKTVYKVT